MLSSHVTCEDREAGCQGGKAYQKVLGVAWGGALGLLQ